MDKNARIFVAGGGKAMGKAIYRALAEQGYTGVIPEEQEPDLNSQAEVNGFFAEHKPEYVFLTAGKSGGIRYNQEHPAELILDNIRIETNVIGAAHDHAVTKLVYFASSCCYPKLCDQPIKEQYLLTGPVEITNEPYSIAKIAGIKLCQAFRDQFGDNFVAAVPTNYFGPGDDFSPENSHVIGALMCRMDAARDENIPRVEIWGTGKPVREFIFIDDLADAGIFLMEKYDAREIINLGGGGDVSIADLARMLKSVIGYEGELYFDDTKPDGMPIKVLESSRLASMGWKPKHTFEDGLKTTYQWYLDRYKK